MLITFIAFGFNATLILLLLFRVGLPLKRELAPRPVPLFVFSPIAIFALFALFDVNEEVRAAVKKNQLESQLKIFRIAAFVGLYLFLYVLFTG